MARIFRLTIDLYPPSEVRTDYCIEVYEKVRSANPNRVLHFGMKTVPTSADYSWVAEVLVAELEALFGRTVGLQEQLGF
jgi:hypothetical protein